MKYEPLVLPNDYFVNIPIHLVFGPDKKLYAGFVAASPASTSRVQLKELRVVEVELEPVPKVTLVPDELVAR